MARDLYNVVDKLEPFIKKYIDGNPEIIKQNQKLITKWLRTKSNELQARKGVDDAAKLRWSKTILKYARQARNVGEWFDKPLNKLTEKDIKKFYKDFETGEIKSSRGVAFSKSNRRDYYKKLFKGGLGTYCGIDQICKEVMVLEASEGVEVSHFLKKDFIAMLGASTDLRHKALMCVAFDLGARIGTILNFRRSDVQKVFDSKSGKHTYRFTIHAENTKSKRMRIGDAFIDETINLFDQFLPTVKEGEFLFPFSYTNAHNIIKRASRRAKVKSKPYNKEVSPHDFRRAMVTHLRIIGVSVDDIKARIGHNPSSRTIDLYLSQIGLLENRSFFSDIQQGSMDELRSAYQRTQELLRVQVESNKEISKENKIFEKAIKELFIEVKRLKGAQK